MKPLAEHVADCECGRNGFVDSRCLYASIYAEEETPARVDPRNGLATALLGARRLAPRWHDYPKLATDAYSASFVVPALGVCA